MKNWLSKMLLVIAVVLAMGLGTQGGWATTTEEMYLSSGTTNILLTSTSLDNLTPGKNEITYVNGNFDGWDIQVAAGTSLSPTLNPFGLDLTSLTVSCNGGGCATDGLLIALTDVNFTQGTPEFGHTFSGSISLAGLGSVTEYAFDDTSNGYFGQITQIGSPLTLNASGVLVATGGGPAGPAPYSLTLVSLISAGSTGMSLDGQITAVPEPASVLLLGSGVFGLGLWGWKRRGSTE